MIEVEICRDILKLLYHIPSSEPVKFLERSDIADKLNLTLDCVREHLEYLSSSKDGNYVSIKKHSTDGKRFYYYVQIKKKGIDTLIEPNEFNKQFPSKVIYQYVAGDKLDVKIGDYATDVIVGKDIKHYKFGKMHNLVDILEYFNKLLEESHSLYIKNKIEFKNQLIYLKKNLIRQDFDLGQIQKIKKALMEFEGSHAPATTAIFSHPCVKNPILKQVKLLIGE